MLNLRPHHLLCLQNYRGHGYDDAFTERMNQVTESLEKDRFQKIRIVQGCDHLCEVCPNRVEGYCNSPDKVEWMDAEVKRICELETDSSLTFALAAETARERILETEQFDFVCGNCSWFELCQSIME